MTLPKGVFDALGVEPLRPLLPAIVDRLTPDGAAEAGGMEPGDHVVAVDGTPVKGWGDWVETIQASPKSLVTEVVRDGRRVELVLTQSRSTRGGRSDSSAPMYAARSKPRALLRKNKLRASGCAW